MSTSGELTADGTAAETQAGGVRLRYHEAGEGPTVLLLHGGGPGATGWGNFSRNVGPLSEHFRLLIPDLPGFGWSEPVALQEDRPTFNAKVMADFLDVVGAEGPVGIVGNSMGGATALELAIARPERVHKLVLLGSGGAGPTMFVPLPTEGDRLIGQNFGNPTRESMRRLVEVMVYDQSLVTDEMIEARLERATDPALREARRNSVRKVGEPLADLEAVQAPTLVVWGYDDRFNPLDTGLRLLAGIPDARLHVFSNCGHWAQVEHADEFNRMVVDFLTH